MKHLLAALRVVVVLTATAGLLYPLAMTGAAQALFPHQANGSRTKEHGSTLIGQSFGGDAKYFQSRPSMAGDGYDPTATAASNLGGESVVDDLVAGKKSLLSQVCERSRAVGEMEGVSGLRPFCAPDGTGATLGVFRKDGLKGAPVRVVSLNQACPAKPFTATFEGRPVECAKPGEDYGRALIVPVRGTATAVVPADAVTAGGSGLDPHISVAYAEMQAARVSRVRELPLDQVVRLIGEHTDGRALGFLGEPGVNVLKLNLALDGKA
ncbi:potassium-transporting ATPase subunit C [Nonomuraea endophytica]|uniref:potassium-transporting ATPase subunit C n=1 Tax=Nonomuraea endophytica TaxID=714136 RepID=UPI0037C5BDCE